MWVNIRNQAGHIGQSTITGATRAFRSISTSGDARLGSVKRVASAVGEGAVAVRYIHEYLTACVALPELDELTAPAAALSPERAPA